ncbi:anaphase-promoting complex, subunit 10/DOC domain-containing protein [Thamnocephalis sphaerospora]|uniref:Anaphase-promoting complex subunit 10 n=1 Tax=Thamnocephalis sphaerospora TaxID=78915 RepID=A0A4P9XKJ6_9FUNG|nr:anaphase-promoting complex, subunit 10/DOC domain-containing protein [Thamnocephalis sphaerospora]|eukprot:RKP06328.1 anaphase-promoting complex, subunit 10/DOC domain-containing protein [Thamnocephalis sphaerospora]
MTAPTPAYRITAEPDEDDLREVGGLGLWSVSSSKPNCGLKHLRDDDITTFWQSDATQPHSVSVQFPRLVSLMRISFYVSFAEDESYTPQELSLYAGNNINELQEIGQLELKKPAGWVNVPLHGADERSPLRTHVLQLMVRANHQNGKDTHIRQIKVYSRAQYTAKEPGMAPYTSLEFLSHSCVR